MSFFKKWPRIIRNIIKLPRIAIASFRFVEAWDLVARGQFDDAEQMFEAGERHLASVPFEYKIMKGEIKHRLKKYDECLDLFGQAWRELDRIDNLSIEERQYLKGWMYGTLEIYRQFFGTSLSAFEEVDICEVPLDKVRKVWKKRFPFRDHPDWDKYGV